jgi:hypothetical protein
MDDKFIVLYYPCYSWNLKEILSKSPEQRDAVNLLEFYDTNIFEDFENSNVIFDLSYEVKCTRYALRNLTPQYTVFYIKTLDGNADPTIYDVCIIYLATFDRYMVFAQSEPADKKMKFKFLVESI